MSVIELPDHESLVDFTDGHPLARWNHSARRFRRAWGLGAAAAFATQGRYGHMLVIFGADADGARLASTLLADAAAADGTPFDWLTAPTGTIAHVETPLGDGNDWDWFWTTEPPALRPGEAAVEPVDIDDAAAVAALNELLKASSPTTSALPGDPTVQRWSGIRDDTGAFVASAAESGWSSGVPNLRAIAVRPDLRGRGLGADITAAVTRGGFEAGAPAVTLGMYTDNDAARRMYERLGFRVGQAFASRTVLPR